MDMDQKENLKALGIIVVFVLILLLVSFLTVHQEFLKLLRP